MLQIDTQPLEFQMLGHLANLFDDSFVEVDTRTRQAPESDDWIEHNFYIPELHGPIILQPYQRAALREAHRRDERGHFVYNLVLWSDIKKSAKSSIAAAVALYRAHWLEWGSIKIIANDLKQADSRVAYYLRRAVTLNPHMTDIKQVNYKTTLPNKTVIEAIPIDPGGEAGGNDDFLIFSELWAARHKAIRQMWTEMTLSPTKFGFSQRWIETYAGYTGESPILEDLWERGTKHGERLDLSYTDDDGEFYDLSDLEIYVEGDMLCLWNDVPRCPWQTPEYYDSERGVHLPEEFNRIHGNVWASSVDKFVPDTWWDDCEGEIPKFDARDSMTLAADAGVSDDHFGLLGGTIVGDTFFIRYINEWIPPKNGKIDFLGTESNPGPEREIARLATRFNVSELRYDKHQLHDMMTRLSGKNRENCRYVDNAGRIVDGPNQGKRLKINTFQFDQGNLRLVADKQLRDRIRERRVVHPGDDRLTGHVGNANAKKDDDEHKMRIVKRSQKLKIDLCVDLSMASYVPEPDKKDKGEVRVW